MIVPGSPQTVAGVAGHYDELDVAYRRIWGEHVHHGYWRSGRESPPEAADALVRLVAERLDLEPGQAVCDIGCGYGATAADLVARHGVSVLGLTVSAAQEAVARSREAAGVTFLRRDWLDNRLPDASFDRAYAIESSEHMPDKQRFFDEAYRTLRPGGQLAVYAWLARPDARAWEERYLLEPICREGRLPGMGSVDDYRGWATGAGFVIDGFEDLSARVRRTWMICARRVAGKLVTHPSYRRFLLDARARNRVFALSLPRIWIAYVTGSMRYGLLTAHKPIG